MPLDALNTKKNVITRRTIPKPASTSDIFITVVMGIGANPIASHSLFGFGLCFFDRFALAASKGSITVSNAKDNGRSIKISGVSLSGGFNESPA